jgi:hypothetical protein
VNFTWQGEGDSDNYFRVRLLGHASVKILP